MTREPSALFLSFVLAPALAAAQTPPGPGAASYNCLPSCSTVDGRALALAGANVGTLVGSDLTVRLFAPGTASSIEVGIFDPDTGGRWDIGSYEPDQGLALSLVADPARDGQGTASIRSWTFDQAYTEHDSAWYTFTVTPDENARTANGSFSFLLRFHNPVTATAAVSVFKVRSTGTLTIPPQPFAVGGLLSSMDDVKAIFPDYAAHASVARTHYDGTFDLYFDVPAGTSSTALELWDGDLDFGAADCNPATQDTNDADTPDAPFLPDWAAGTGAVPEGVASGTVRPCGKTTGSPPDDAQIELFKRAPSIGYDVAAPPSAGAPDPPAFANNNPSGNLEWEKFAVGNGEPLPAGVWTIHIHGADLGNLLTMRLPYELLCVTDGETGARARPCTPAS